MTNNRCERVSNPCVISYKDALLGCKAARRHDSSGPAVHSPAAAPVAQTNDHLLAELKSSLRDALRENPGGIHLPHLRRLCPLLVDPEVLRSPHPSIRHLLVSLSDVVKLQGIGVQTLVLPCDSTVPPAEEQNNGPRLIGTEARSTNSPAIKARSQARSRHRKSK